MDDSSVETEMDSNTNSTGIQLTPMEISFLATSLLFVLSVVLGFIYFILYNTSLFSGSSSSQSKGGGAGGGGGEAKRKTQTHMTFNMQK